MSSSTKRASAVEAETDQSYTSLGDSGEQHVSSTLTEAPLPRSERVSAPYSYSSYQNLADHRMSLPIQEGVVVGLVVENASGRAMNGPQLPTGTSSTKSTTIPTPLPNSNSGQQATYDTPYHRHDEGTAASLPYESFQRDHRGFSTGIDDLMRFDEHERVDCCALACCGILQHDRDRYLITGVTPPSLGKRVAMHILVPLTIFLAAGVWAMRVGDVMLNELGATALLLLLVLYFMLQCAKGRAKRIAIRKDLLFTKYKLFQQMQEQSHQQEHLLASTRGRASSSYHSLAAILEHERPRDEDDEENADRDFDCCGSAGCFRGRLGNREEEREYYLGQKRSDLYAAHPCCLLGCYPDDGNSTNSTNAVTNSIDSVNATASIRSCLFRALCPRACGCHVQLCGLCALAQEARDIEQCILPPSYRRIDYITMEAVLNYYPAIYQQRHRLDSPPDMGLADNAAAVTASATTTTPLPQPQSVPPRHQFLGIPLSRLSHRLVRNLGLFWLLLLCWSILGSYSWSVVLGQRGHVLQSQHRFLLADWAILVATFLSSFTLLYLCSHLVNRHGQQAELSLDAIVKYFASGFFLSASLALFWEMVTALTINTVVSILLAILGIDRAQSPQTNWTPTPTLGTKSLLWLHSILPSLDGGTNAASAAHPDFMTVFGLDHPVVYTLYILIATFVVAGFIEEVCKYFGYRMVEHPDFMTRQELEDAAAIMCSNNPDSGDNPENEDIDAEEEDRHMRSNRRSSRLLDDWHVFDFSEQRHSIQSRGAAITLAMVAVAIGFACCENLVYIFLYAGESVELELGVLLERSFFPIHPILAAIQSIGVCRRELEGPRGTSTKLGRILLPAVLFHGTFDFAIVFIAFVGKVMGRSVEEGDLRISNVTELASIVCCVWIMIAALVYLYRESTLQRRRLASLDQEHQQHSTSDNRVNLI